jgi:DNA invertase Pin-like site-specific DNA recombinase
MATLPIPFPARNGRPRKKVDAKRILALRAQGRSWREIAKRMHVGIGTAFRAAQGRSKSVS